MTVGCWLTVTMSVETVTDEVVVNPVRAPEAPIRPKETRAIAAVVNIASLLDSFMAEALEA